MQTDHHQRRLLLSCLHRHEAHRRSTHRLAKRRRAGRIILAALHIGFGQLRRDQLHLMAERPQKPRPMVGCAAGFDPYDRRRQRLEEGHHLLAPQFLAQHHLLGGVHPVHLEKMFRRVHPDSANLFHGRPLLSEISNDLILAQSMPPGAVHTNSKPPCAARGAPDWRWRNGRTFDRKRAASCAV